MARDRGKVPRDFVLKLSSDDGASSSKNISCASCTEFRRVLLSQIDGSITFEPRTNRFVVVLKEHSFADLMRRATDYFSPDATSSSMVRLTYKDEDGDWVVLGSTEELQDTVAGVLGQRDGHCYMPIRVKVMGKKADLVPCSDTAATTAALAISSTASSASSQLKTLSFPSDCSGRRTWKRVAICLVAFSLVVLDLIRHGAIINSEHEHAKNCTASIAPVSTYVPSSSFPTSRPRLLEERHACSLHTATQDSSSASPSESSTTTDTSPEPIEVGTPLSTREDSGRVTESLKDLFSDILQDEDPTSPFMKAYQWVMEDPHWKSYSKARLRQRLGLVAFYYATNPNATWRRSDNWLSHQVHECNWFPGGFTMSVCGEGHYEDEQGKHWQYERLWLPNNGLEGTLPPKLFLLIPSLRHVRLDRNIWLSGSLPSELGSLTQISSLWLQHNMFSGSIPSELGQLSTLEKLCLAENDLQGSIPPQMFDKLTNLRALWLDHNRLSGPIPSEIGTAPLVKLNLGRNHFAAGGLPASMLGSLSQLEHLVAPIRMASSSGEDLIVPSQVGLLTNLRHLDMYVSPSRWMSLSSHKWDRSEVATLYNLDNLRVGTEGNDDDLIDILTL